MSYNKTSWISGDIISAEKMNKLENGLESVSNNCDELSTKTTSLENKLNDILDDTLTDPNKAAQAKKVGDKIDELKEDLAQMKETCVQEVIDALGTPVFGTMDENNNITLTGKLVDGQTYTFKYEDEDGNVTELGTVVKENTPSYTNQIPISIDSDGSIFNGIGYKPGYRVRSTGDVVEANTTSICCTGFIPYKLGDIIYLKNLKFCTSGGSYQSNISIFVADASFAKVEAIAASNMTSSSVTEVDENNCITKIYTANLVGDNGSNDCRSENVAYFRISADNITDESIITVNEEIV